jgi:hypothetical protein
MERSKKPTLRNVEKDEVKIIQTMTYSTPPKGQIKKEETMRK